MRWIRMATLCGGLAAALLASPAPADERSGDGGLCGGPSGLVCDDGLWCDPPARSCDIRGPIGVCVAPPGVCAQDYRPVCGCDGKTYSNDCTRQAARVALDHAGACPGPG